MDQRDYRSSCSIVGWMYRILLVIHTALNNVRFKAKQGVLYRPNLISHSATLYLQLRESPNRGMRYKLEVRVSLREYGRMPLTLCPVCLVLTIPQFFLTLWLQADTHGIICTEGSISVYVARGR